MITVHIRNQIILTTKLYNLYRQINKRLFGDTLPMSQITFYPIPGCYGEVYIDSCKQFPIIVLNHEYFKRGVKHIIEIIIHEMVHIYCDLHKIEEINYKTGYHNIKFKKACELIGMKCDKSKSDGFNIVTIPNNLLYLFTEHLNDKQLVQLISMYN